VNASKYISDGNYIGLISYDDYVYIDLPVGKFDAKQKAYFSGAVKNLSAGGATATYDAVLVGLKMLDEKQAEVPNAKLMLFVLSDGAQNMGYNLNKVTPIVAGMKVPVHSIGYNADLDELGKLSAINEASVVNASSDDVVYSLRNMFRAQM
jgi:Ca-activated chloride channel family protein